MKKILTVVGTRPNFIKVTQFERNFARFPEEFEFRLCHTGQHYDDNMSAVFFRQLKIRKPDYHLGIDKGTPGNQVGRIITALDAVLQDWQPDLLMVVGDVNSTLAASIAGNKAGVKLAHVESGLRSEDRGMPEEINRILTDELADILFVTEQSGYDNLLEKGKDASQLAFVGNTMIDTLLAFQDDIQQSDILNRLGIASKSYALMTMHRPATVDHLDGLHKMLAIIDHILEHTALVFPIHPRTVARLEKHGLMDGLRARKNIYLLEPQDYFSFQRLITGSRFVVTDSGGIQEETTYYQIPCLTLRPNTERPSTITIGSNELLPLEVDQVASRIEAIENGTYKFGEIPPMWDGKASERIVGHLRAVL